MKRQMPRAPLSGLLLLLLCLAPLSVSAQPIDWLRDMGLFKKRTEPKYQDIEFWDPIEKTMRGIRVFLYTTLVDERNRLLDQRLHDQMQQYLASICQTVVTLEAFEEPVQKRQVENVMVDLQRQFRKRGQVNPRLVAQQAPFLEVDAVIFLERTAYDAGWQGKDRVLNIGFTLTAVELDLGEPLFAERFLTDVEWTGRDTNYIQAEKEALLEAADALGKQLQQVAAMINKLHREEELARKQAEQAQERQRQEQQRQAFRDYQALAQSAKQMLDQREQPPALIAELRQQMESFEPLLDSRALPEAQMQLRRQLAGEIRNTMDAIQEYAVTGQLPQALASTQPAQPSPNNQAARQQPAGDEPLVPVDWEIGADDGPDDSANGQAENGMQPVPRMDVSSRDPFDRSWLIP